MASYRSPKSLALCKGDLELGPEEVVLLIKFQEPWYMSIQEKWELQKVVEEHQPSGRCAGNLLVKALDESDDVSDVDLEAL